jgi:uncharacterized protein YcfJ
MKKIIISILLIGFTTISFAETIKIRVATSDPITRESRVQVPHTTYVEEQVQIPYDCGGKVDKNSIGIDTVIGTVLGVAIGNQIGGGSGRDVAKVVAGLSGGYIANQHRNDGQTCYKMEFRSVPVTTYETEIRERIVGYKNCGYLGDHEICKQTKRKMRHIKIQY